MQTRASLEISNASAAAFARTLFQSRSDTIKRQEGAWREHRYKNIGSHSSLSSLTPFIARIRETIVAVGNFLAGELRDEFRGNGETLEKEGESGREQPLEARKISKHDSVSNSLFTSLDLEKGVDAKKCGVNAPTLHARETFVIFHRIFPFD